MDTNFNLAITSQSTMFFDDIKIKAYDKLIEISKEHEIAIRFIGLPLALCTSLIDLAEAISTIFESLIKGIINIVGSPFSEKCHVLKGVKQIFLQIPLHLISGAIDWSIMLALDIPFATIGMLISPTTILPLRKTVVETSNGIIRDLSEGKTYVTNALPIHKRITAMITQHRYT
jgi:hypothetical protein